MNLNLFSIHTLEEEIHTSGLRRPGRDTKALRQVLANTFCYQIINILGFVGWMAFAMGTTFCCRRKRLATSQDTHNKVAVP